jgi:hypothetical protein
MSSYSRTPRPRLTDGPNSLATGCDAVSVRLIPVRDRLQLGRDHLIHPVPQKLGMSTQRGPLRQHMNLIE